MNWDEERRLRERLAKPDGIVFRSDREIVDEINPFVVALIGPQGPGLGSGLLVQLWERFFILTAGHVVRAVAELRGAPVQLVIAHDTHNARFQLVQRAAISGADNDDEDFGFFELPPYDVSRIRARDKIFASHKRIHVDEQVAADDLFVVSGFPKELVVGAHSQQWLKHCLWLTASAGTRNVPTTKEPTPVWMRTVDLVVDDGSGFVLDFRTRDGSPDAICLKSTIDPMPGVSGGPCWRTFVSHDAATWNVKRLKVVATHRARFTQQIDGRPYWFARQVGIGHHLKLIADRYSELAERIYQEWPALISYPKASRPT